MNSFERVMKTVTGEETERPAFTLLLSLYGAKLTGCPLERYFSDPASYSEGQSAVLETFRPDLLFSPFTLTSIGEAFGSRIKYFQDYAPNIKEFAIGHASEFDTLEIPDVDSSPELMFIRESVRILASRYRNEVPVIGAVPCPADIPPLIMGMEQWMDCILFDEKIASYIMEKCSDFFVDFGNALLEDGATILAFPGMFVNPEILPAKKIMDFVIPYMKSSLSRIKGPVVFHHGGNKLASHIHLFRDLPNIAGFAMDSRDSLDEARKNAGDAYIILGNIDGPSLSLQTSENIIKKCTDILKDRNADRKFIFLSSGADIPFNTPEENISAISSCIINHRRST